MSDKWQIVVVNTEKVWNQYEVELSHNKNKTEWYVAISADFYTEFTFKTEQQAVSFHKLAIESSNIFMYSLTANIPEKEVNHANN